MFKELVPYLRHRAMMLTVTHLGEDQISRKRDSEETEGWRKRGSDYARKHYRDG